MRTTHIDLNIENQIIEILQKYLDKNQYAYFLFGSRAAGNNRHNSDYDIGIYSKETLNYDQFLLIKGELDEKINALIDLVDFHKVDTKFKYLALKKIKLWNKPKNLLIN